MTFADTPQRRLTPLKLLGSIGLALLGGAVGYGVGQFADGRSLGWEDGLALGVASLLAAFALMGMVAMAKRPAVIPKGCGLLQITVAGLAAAMLAIPVLTPSEIPANLVLTGILALLVGQSIANLMLWQRADEMLRRVMADTSALAFWVLQMALFVYAAAERLGLIESITAWGMMGIVMAIYMIASFVVAARRGMG